MKTIYQALKTEITAGKVMFVKDDKDRLWNQALDKALRHIKMYENEQGLFQDEVNQWLQSHKTPSK